MGIAGVLSRYVDERAGLAGKGIQQGLNLVELVIVEARADPAQIVEAVGYWYADEQGTHSALAPALSGSPAAADNLLTLVQLDLEPAPGPLAGLVRRVAALGDDSLQLELPARLDGGLQIAVEDRRHLDAGAGLRLDELFEYRATLQVGLLEQRPAIEFQNVEQHQLGGIDLGGSLDIHWLDEVDSMLQQAELRPASMIKDHHFAVQDRALQIEPSQVLGNVEVGRRVVTTPPAE